MLRLDPQTKGSSARLLALPPQSLFIFAGLPRGQVGRATHALVECRGALLLQLRLAACNAQERRSVQRQRQQDPVAQCVARGVQQPSGQKQGPDGLQSL